MLINFNNVFPKMQSIKEINNVMDIIHFFIINISITISLREVNNYLNLAQMY